MEQFSLEKYLKDKSRKVVTRDGRQVKIVCWNMKSMSPIVGIIQDRLGGEFIRSYTINGRYSTKNESEYDIFFADEEEKLTEFEKCIQNILNEPHFQDVQAVKQFSKILFDLARKEIIKEVEQKSINHTYAYQNGYENGRFDMKEEMMKDAMDAQVFQAETAKDILAGILAHANICISETDKTRLTKLALSYTEELMRQLKEKEKK